MQLVAGAGRAHALSPCPGRVSKLKELFGTDAESFNDLRDGLGVSEAKYLDLKAEAIEFLNDAEVQAQTDLVAQALLDQTTLSNEQLCEISLTAARLDRCNFFGKNWRRRPDLNRGWRFCRATLGHFA